MSWALVLTAPPDELEVMAADLFEMGALGVELQEPGMPLMPGTPELPAGRARAIAHFDERYGLGADASLRYPENIQAVSAREVLECAQRLLDPRAEVVALVAPEGVEL